MTVATPKEPAAPVAWQGFVSTAPEAVGEEFTVQVPGFDDDHVFQIRRWESRGATIPAEGDEVLLLVDDKQEPWVLAWWPAGGDVPVIEAIPSLFFDVEVDGGALADGTPQTSKIQATLDKAEAAGGGWVLVRKRFRTGMLRHPSNVGIIGPGCFEVDPKGGTPDTYLILNKDVKAGNENCYLAVELDGNKGEVPGDRGSDVEKPSATVLYTAQNEGAFCRNITVDCYQHDAKRLGVALIDVDGFKVTGLYENNGRDAVTIIGDSRNGTVDFVAKGCGDDALGLNAENAAGTKHDLFNVTGRVVALGPGDDGPGIGITVRGARDIDIDLFALGIEGWAVGIFDAFGTKAQKITITGSAIECGGYLDGEGKPLFYSQAAAILAAGVIHAPGGEWAAVEHIDLSGLKIFDPGDMAVELKSARGAYGSMQHIKLNNLYATYATYAVLFGSSYIFDVTVDDLSTYRCENGIVSTHSMLSLYIRDPTLYHVIGGKGIWLKDVASGVLNGVAVGNEGTNGQVGILLENLIGDWVIGDNLATACSTNYDYSKIGTPKVWGSAGRAVPMQLPMKIAGSRDGNAALANVLSALDEYGVLDDATEAGEAPSPGKHASTHKTGGTDPLAASDIGAQPVDSDLTAIAALATTEFGRALLTKANAAAVRTTLELGSAALSSVAAFDAAGAAAAAQAASAAATHTHAQSDVTGLLAALEGKQPLDSDLSAIAALTTTEFGRNLLIKADVVALREALGLVFEEKGASGALTLTTELKDIPGCTYTTKAAGTFLCRGIFDFTGTEATFNCFGVLLADGAEQTGKAQFGAAGANDRKMVIQEWKVTLGSAKILKLQAKQNGGKYTASEVNTKLIVEQIAA